METPERLERTASPDLDRLLGVPFKVLDDGFLRVVDYMGNDSAVVQAARVSYGEGTKKIREDRGLIRYLMRHRHTTPFEMCELKLHVRVPMDTWRQWIRHRTASVNEYSTRYSLAIDSAQRTAADEWRQQASANRQGSAGSISDAVGARLTSREAELLDASRKVYEERIVEGVAREQARKDLPLSTYTEAYWKSDLHNLLHFLSLRMDAHAQHEIRSYAAVLGDAIVSKWCPLVWEAFCDYRRNGLALYRDEALIVRHLVAGETDAAISVAEDVGLLQRVEGGFASTRERLELDEKLAQLGIQPPWLGVKR